MRRRVALAVVVLLVSLGGFLTVPPAARAVGAWAGVAPRPVVGGEETSTATTLTDGRVLVTGTYTNTGENQAGGTAWLYDPAADRWTQAAAFDPNAGNANPVLLPDGRVLFAGGPVVTFCPNPSCQSNLLAAQLYDPAANRWSPARSMSTVRAGHSATLLPDGTVLVVGGDVSSRSAPITPTPTTERYDPRADRWVAAAPLAATRAGHAAARLNDGRVLIVGGVTAGAAPAYPVAATAAVEIYDPAADRWSAAASLDGAGTVATILTSGLVLVVGWRQEAPAGPITTSAAVYIPDADRWDPTTPPKRARGGLGLAALPDGRALLVGGELGGAQGVPDLYTPGLNAWVDGAPTRAGRFRPIVATLKDGRIFVAGTEPSDRAEIYTDRPEPAACFAETGQCVRGRFLAYWQANGGLARNGYPLTDERTELLEDGRAYTVQYFERVRLEYHPQNAPSYDVLLGQFGRRIALTGLRGGDPADTARAAPRAGESYFEETGHNLGGPFLAYWGANGGLTQFGFPLTEPFTQALENGQPYTVQYFERARLELHTDGRTGQPIVLLGQFGRQVLAENATLASDPAFLHLFITNPRVQEGLGNPSLASSFSAPGAYQRFERGAMIYRGDLRGIFVLCGGETTGRVLLPSPPDALFFPDRWREGDPPGGGAGPRAGLYEPARGFGKLWRDDATVRDCLGHAVAERETGYTLRGVAFSRGIMLAADDPTGAFIYALRRVGLDWTYERFPAAR